MSHHLVQSAEQVFACIANAIRHSEGPCTRDKDEQLRREARRRDEEAGLRHPIEWPFRSADPMRPWTSVWIGADL